MKRNNIRITSFILIGLITGITSCDLCMALEIEHQTIYVNEHVYFHTDNATFNVTGDIPLSGLTRTDDYMRFNTTRFYVIGAGTNITVDFIASSMVITGFNKVLSFYNNDTSSFNISGFVVGATYGVYIDTVLSDTIFANVTGFIDFLVSDTNWVYVEIYHLDSPEVFGDINTTLNVYTTMYIAGFLLFIFGIWKRNLTFTGCSFVLFIILWVQSINISVPFISITNANEYTLGNQQHLDPAVGASCWLFIIIDILILFYYFLGWWRRRRGDEPAMP